MTIRDALNIANGISHLDAELLLAAAVGHDRAWLITHADESVPEGLREPFIRSISRRRSGEPLAYILGMREFYGRQFLVNSSVLIPRPATEGLIDAALRFMESPNHSQKEIDSGIVALSIPMHDIKPTTIVDVGTGSGIIAITLVKLCNNMHIIATDNSSSALAVARKNAREHSVQDAITFVREDQCETIQSLHEPFLIVTNPPYIPQHSAEIDASVAAFEPANALFAGEDGLNIIHLIIKVARSNPHCTGIVMECRSDQVKAILQLLEHRR